MDLVNAFLGVIAIIGIIVVGGFVIFFLGDLVLSILDPNYVRFGKGYKKGENSSDKEDIKVLDGPKQETKEIEYKPIQTSNEVKEDKKVSSIEQGLGEKFFDDINVSKKEEDEELIKSSDMNALRAEEEQFRLNMLKSIEERRQRKEQNEVQKDIDFEKFFFDDDDIDVFENEAENETENEAQNVIDYEIVGQQNIADLIPEDEKLEIVNNEETVENVEPQEEVENIENQEEKAEDVKAIDEKEVENLRDKYEAEIARLENEKLAIKQQNEMLEKEKIQAKEEIAKLVDEKLNISKSTEENYDKKKNSNLSIEEYEERLKKLQERLLENDKDFRRVKKDFIPLKKVYNTLEADEKKLRRREAIVAKQKVDLYGVNNIVDIDQEKAKKLTEDLDLLEGLKLSVKHCEEVMNANKERYPILEKTYNILLKSNQTLKADIEETEKAIAKLKEENE